MRSNTLYPIPLSFCEPWQAFDNLFQWTPRLLQQGQPAVDIVEDENSYTVTAEVPGFTKEQVEIEIRDNMVVITGNTEEQKNADNIDRSRERLLHSERMKRSFQRMFQFPCAIDQKAATAKFVDGVLTVHLPKQDQAISRKLSIE